MLSQEEREKLKSIFGENWKPIEERTPEEQEDAYDRIFDWEDED